MTRPAVRGYGRFRPRLSRQTRGENKWICSLPLICCFYEAIPIDQRIEDLPARPGALEGAVKKLPGAQRELIDLPRRREHSYQELARLTKISVRAVAGRLFRERPCLRNLLRYDGADQ
jgi:DNA-directed RNA polymerase specialized sigma24 family protein